MSKSPCIKVCEIDPKTGFCHGCKRNIQEISEWFRLSEKEKSEILKKLDSRSVKKK
tara:strand:+ start:254 stop:421 length:168 start_codon:yes stop_codon:yes gene_type:complete